MLNEKLHNELKAFLEREYSKWQTVEEILEMDKWDFIVKASNYLD